MPHPLRRRLRASRASVRVRECGNHLEASHSIIGLRATSRDGSCVDESEVEDQNHAS